MKIKGVLRPCAYLFVGTIVVYVLLIKFRFQSTHKRDALEELKTRIYNNLLNRHSYINPQKDHTLEGNVQTTDDFKPETAKIPATNSIPDGDTTEKEGDNAASSLHGLDLRRTILKPLEQFNKDVLLFTAIISNTTGSRSWNRLTIQGWEHRKLISQKYTCCVKYKSGSVTTFHVSGKVKRVYRVAMEARQFLVYLGNSNHGNGFPMATTLVRFGENCPVENEMYVLIEYVYRKPTEIAIFAKVLYGNVSAADLLAWFELHSLLGFDKAVFYTYRLSQNVTKVLEYYRQKGKAEIVPFAFPEERYDHADMKRMKRGTPHFNNEDVALLDGQERLQGYKYVVSFDIDEYILPAKDETWMELFDRLFEGHPNAAGFTFGTYLYTTSWGPTSNSSIFMVGRYLNRTRLTEDCVKHVTIPDRLMMGTLYTHAFKPRHGFKGYTVPEHEGSVRHYRACRGRYKNTDTTCFQFQRVHDESVYRLLTSIEGEVLKLKNKLHV